MKKGANGKAQKKAMRLVWGNNTIHGLRRAVTVSRTYPSLPDEHHPVVIKLIKRSELDAISSKGYEVKVIREMTRIRSTGEIDGEDELLVAIRESEKHTRQLIRARQAIRNSFWNRDDGGGDPPSSNPFKEPINQHEMADSIIKVMHDFFHGEEKCHIGDMDFTDMEFCVMMHIFFKKIHSLKKEARSPFSTFLQNKVFAGKSGFVRTFNKYADKKEYKDFEEYLGEIKPHYFDMRPAPLSPEKILSDYQEREKMKMKFAFQEIGYAFQKSDCFTKLKKLRENMNEIVLQ